MYGGKHCGEAPADCEAVGWNKVNSSYSKVLARQPRKTAVGLNAGTITCMLPISHHLSWEGGDSSFSGAKAVGQGERAAQA